MYFVLCTLNVVLVLFSQINATFLFFRLNISLKFCHPDDSFEKWALQHSSVYKYEDQLMFGGFHKFCNKICKYDKNCLLVLIRLRLNPFKMSYS